MSKDHFYFSRNDRIVALVLLAIIIIAIIIRMPHHSTIVEPDKKEDLFTQPPEKEPSPKRNTSGNRQITDSSRTSLPNGRDMFKRNKYVKDTLRNYTFKDESKRADRYPSKSRPSSPLDLNSIDSARLVLLPGIGPVFASRIMKYREQLGGFTSTKQLLELNGLPDTLMEWFIIGDSIPLKAVQVNKMTLNELRRHPYINFYQARAIVELRRERGNIKGPEQLSLLDEFTAQDLERLKPYLDFR